VADAGGDPAAASISMSEAGPGSALLMLGALTVPSHAR
jgi:hypothetical protein